MTVISFDEMNALLRGEAVPPQETAAPLDLEPVVPPVSVSFDEMETLLRGYDSPLLKARSPQPQTSGVSLDAMEALLRQHDAAPQEPAAPETAFFESGMLAPDSADVEPSQPSQPIAPSPQRQPAPATSFDPLAFTKREEGFREEAYPDLFTGQPLIGHGQLLDVKSRPGLPAIAQRLGLDLNALASGKAKLAPEQADALMRASMPDYERLVDRTFGTNLAPQQRAALVDMAYRAWNRDFSPQLVEAVKAGDHARAAQLIATTYPDPRLKGRAERRADLYRGGVTGTPATSRQIAGIESEPTPPLPRRPAHYPANKEAFPSLMAPMASDETEPARPPRQAAPQHPPTTDAGPSLMDAEGFPVPGAEESAGPPGMITSRLASGSLGLAAGFNASRAKVAATTLSAFDEFDRTGRPPAILRSEHPRSGRVALVADYMQATPDERAIMRQDLTAELAGHIGTLADLTERQRKYAPSPATQAALQAKTFREFLDAAGENPALFVAEVGLESLPASAPMMLLGGAGGLIGGRALATIGGGVGSTVVENMTGLIEGLIDQGIDPRDTEAVAAVLRDPERREALSRRAATGAAPVGAFDAAAVNVATRNLGPARIASPLMRQVVNLALQSPTQGALGAAGEAGKQIAQGEELRAGPIASEFAGEFFGAPVEALSLGAATRYGRVGIEEVSAPPLPRRGVKRAERIEPTIAMPEGLGPIEAEPVPAPPDAATQEPTPQAGPVTRTIRTAQGDVTIAFPDENHARLFDYGADARLGGFRKGEGAAAERDQRRRELFELWRDFIVRDDLPQERFDTPRHVDSWSIGLYDDLAQQARAAAMRGERAIEVGEFVDPDRAGEYWKRFGRGAGTTAAPAAAAPPGPTTEQAPTLTPREAAEKRAREAKEREAREAEERVRLDEETRAQVRRALETAGRNLEQVSPELRGVFSYALTKRADELVQNFGSIVWTPPQGQARRIADWIKANGGVDTSTPRGESSIALDTPAGRLVVIRPNFKSDSIRFRFSPVSSTNTGLPTAEPTQAPTVTPQPVTPAPSSGFDTVITPRGRKVEVEPVVVEADSLIASHTDDLSINPAFPQALQPRDRSRAASAAQIAEIAGRLEPGLLGRSASATDGAPIIGRDRIVESGNARVLGIRRAYQQNPEAGQRYRDWITAQGFDVSGFRNPVLVRRRLTDLSPADREAFAREANERSTLAMGATEQATADAKAMPDWLLDLYKGGDLNLAGNRDFARKFVDTIASSTEAAALRASDGSLSQEGLRRVGNALFARAYGDPELLAALRESTDTNFKSIGEALMDAAPAWARLRAGLAAGRVSPTVDATKALLDAVRIVRQARDSKQPIRDFVRIDDIFGGAVPRETVEALRLMFNDADFKRPTSRMNLAGALRFYVNQAERAVSGPGLLGDAPKVSAIELLRLARQRREGGLLPDAAEMRALSSPADRDRRRTLVEQFMSAPAGTIIKDTTGRDWGLTTTRDRGYVAVLLHNGIEPSKQWGARRANFGWSKEQAASEAARRMVERERRAEPVYVDTAEARQNMTPGANYVGFAPQTYNPAITATGAPIRREGILKDLVTALGAPIYTGRVKGKNTLGFYRKRLEEVRIKTPGDLETAIHEAAHLLDDRIPEISRQWRPASNANAAVRRELAGVSYDKTKLFEGFAEFVRLWATQNPQAQAKAPRFFAWFEDFTTRSEYGPALRRFQEQATAWFDQAALDRAKSKIGPTADINEGLTPRADRLRQSILDDLHGVMKMERELTGDLQPAGAYETARLVRGAAGIIEGAMRIGAPVAKPDGSHSFVGKSLTEILKPVTPDLDNALLYFVGRAARELRAQGREHLFTAAEIKAMLALETPEFRTAFAEYQTWNKAIVDFAEAKGIINPAFRAMWKRAAYVPFHREGRPGLGGFSPVPGQFAGVKELTGGTNNLRDILGNMVSNASMLIEAALTNEARLKVLALAKQPGGARFMAEIPTEERVEKVHFAEVERVILEALGVKSMSALTPEQQAVVAEIINNLKPFAEFLVRGQAPLGPDVIAVMDGGAPRYFQVADPLLYRSLIALKRPVPHWLMKVFSVPRRIGQLSVTLSPDFMAANLVRDTAMAGIMSRTGFKPIFTSLRGLASRLREDDNYKEFLANGGGISSYLRDEQSVRQHLDLFYKRRGLDPMRIIDSPRKFLRLMERLAESIEVSARLGEYRRAVARGAHPRHAAYLGREVSTDFAMRGDEPHIGFLYDSVVFLKAAVNGLDRFYRGVAHDPNKGGIMAKAALIGLFSMGLYALNRDDPAYDELPDWQKDAYWHIPLPNLENPDAPTEFVKVPKLWEVGLIGTLAERSLGALLDGVSVETGRKMLEAIGHSLGFDLVPQLVNPALEVAINRDRFTGARIETRELQELEPWARAKSQTSTVMRNMGEGMRDLPPALQLSPAQVEHLLKGYLNSWAVMGLSLVDAALFDDKPDARLDQYPVVRRFYQGQPAVTTQYMTDLRKLIEESNDVRRTMRFMDRTYRPEFAEEMVGEVANRQYGQLQAADKVLRAMRKETDAVIRVPTLDGTQALAIERARNTRNPTLVRDAQVLGVWNDIGALKRYLIDDVTRERNAYARETLGWIKTERKAMETRP